MAIFTIGYEGMSTQVFVKMLADLGITDTEGRKDDSA